MNNLLDHALAYLDRGWSLIPTTNSTGKGKKPDVGTWKQYQTKRPTAANLRKWFRSLSVHGIGVVCGPVSGGLIVRDFDRMEAYETWALQHPRLAAALPTVETARGRHVYIAGDLDTIITLEDGELRGGGGYVLAPPSIHPSGHIYSWLVPLPDGPLPRLDPVEAGLVPTEKMSSWYRREQKENGCELKITECHGGGGKPQTQKPKRRVNVDELEPEVQEAIQQAIQSAIPENVGTRNRRLFKLARSLKGIDALADVDPLCFRSVVKKWHQLALPVVNTKMFDETWADFLRAWDKVKYPRGIKLRAILARAKKALAPPEAEKYDDPRARLLVKLCRELQIEAGTAPFFLSSRVAAEMIRVPTMTAWRYLYLFERDSLLLPMERGNVGGKATRYRYLGDIPGIVVVREATTAMVNRAFAKVPTPAEEARKFQRHKADQLAKLRAIVEAEQSHGRQAK